MNPGAEPDTSAWPMLSRHAHVLLCLATEPDIRCRDVADRTGISERAAHAVIAQLVDHGYFTRVRQGRRNHYELHPDACLHLPVGGPRSVAALLEVLGRSRPSARCAGTTPEGRPT
jgi:hypothetical protein